MFYITISVVYCYLVEVTIMKKYLILCAIAIMLMVPIAGATTTIDAAKNEQLNPLSKQDFTHTVIVEYATLTTCGPCVTASTQLYNIYNDGDLDFYYVSLVGDVGLQRINKRLQQLGVYAVPDVVGLEAINSSR